MTLPSCWKEIVFTWRITIPRFLVFIQLAIRLFLVCLIVHVKYGSPSVTCKCWEAAAAAFKRAKVEKEVLNKLNGQYETEELKVKLKKSWSEDWGAVLITACLSVLFSGP